jgi:hypothetical protein
VLQLLRWLSARPSCHSDDPAADRAQLSGDGVPKEWKLCRHHGGM